MRGYVGTSNYHIKMLRKSGGMDITRGVYARTRVVSRSY
jgi:hypothetical protein